METLPLLVSVIQLIVGIALILAILRIFSIDATLKKILQAVKTADKNRRDEFEALAQGEEESAE